MWIQSNDRELSKITLWGSTNKKQADEQNCDFFFLFFNVSDFQLSLFKIKSTEGFFFFFPCWSLQITEIWPCSFSHSDFSNARHTSFSLGRQVFWHVAPKWLLHYSASCSWTHTFSACTAHFYQQRYFT